MQPHPSPAVPRGALSRRIVGAAAVGVLSMGAVFAPVPAVATTRSLPPTVTVRER